MAQKFPTGFSHDTKSPCATRGMPAPDASMCDGKHVKMVRRGEKRVTVEKPHETAIRGKDRRERKQESFNDVQAAGGRGAPTCAPEGRFL